MFGHSLMKKNSVIAFVLLSCSTLVAAESGQDWLQKADAFSQKQQWPAAANAFEQASKQTTLSGSEWYNYACVLALSEQTARAIDALSAAIDAGFTNVSHMQNDSDLTSLRTHSRWPQLLNKAENKRQLEQKRYGATALETAYQPQLSEAERVAGLSRLWSEAKYNFANFDLIPDTDWDALYLQTLPRVQAAKSTKAYYDELVMFMAKLRDGHTGVYYPTALHNTVYARPAIRTRLIENRVMVTQVGSDELRAAGVHVGSKIVMINAMPVHEYATQQIAPFASASTPQDRQTRLYNYQLLSGDVNAPVRLTLHREGEKAREIVVPRLTPVERNQLAGFSAPSFEWKMLPGNIAWVALNEFGSTKAADEYLRQFADISQAKAIIFDVRRNGGGNSDVGYRILSTLTDQSFATSSWASRKYVPVWRAWQRSQSDEGGSGRFAAHGQLHFRGNVIVLTSAETYSAAEDFVGAFKQMKRGVIMGEATGGSTGQPLTLPLPGGGSARICSKRDRLADGTEFVGVGIAPDLIVTETVAGLRAGRDDVLLAAIDHLTSR